MHNILRFFLTSLRRFAKIGLSVARQGNIKLTEDLSDRFDLWSPFGFR